MSKCADGPPPRTSGQTDDCCKKPSEFPDNILKLCAYQDQLRNNGYNNYYTTTNNYNRKSTRRSTTPKINLNGKKSSATVSYIYF